MFENPTNQYLQNKLSLKFILKLIRYVSPKFFKLYKSFMLLLFVKNNTMHYYHALQAAVTIQTYQIVATAIANYAYLSCLRTLRCITINISL